MNNLPNEIILDIVSWLKPTDLMRCQLVNRNWYNLCIDDTLWQRHVKVLTGYNKSKVKDSYYQTYLHYCNAKRTYRIFVSTNEYKTAYFSDSLNNCKRYILSILQFDRLILNDKLVLTILSHHGAQVHRFLSSLKKVGPIYLTDKYGKICDDYMKKLPHIIDDAETFDGAFKYEFHDNVNFVAEPIYG